MAKRYLIAGNWKANFAPDGFNASDSPYRPHPDAEIIVFPMSVDIRTTIDAGLQTGAQVGYGRRKEGQTGDVTMDELTRLGCTHVLCGHSERREHHGETVEDVLEQVNAALAAGLKPILCIGEKIEERAAGKEKQVVEAQLKGSPSGIIIAYEPVWAIGSGQTATPAQAQEMHAFIRSILPDKKIRILYGGSMNAKNCEELLKQTDIDGGLIGGASLKPDEFLTIVKTASRLSK